MKKGSQRDHPAGKDQQKERRSSPRRKVSFDLAYVIVSGKDGMLVSTSRPGQGENLSPEGLSFKTREIVVDGLHISYDLSSRGVVRNYLGLEFGLPGVSRKIRTTATVVWYQRVPDEVDTYFVGVRFLNLEPEYRAAIQGLI